MPVLMLSSLHNMLDFTLSSFLPGLYLSQKISVVYSNQMIKREGRKGGREGEIEGGSRRKEEREEGRKGKSRRKELIKKRK